MLVVVAADDDDDWSADSVLVAAAAAAVPVAAIDVVAVGAADVGVDSNDDVACRQDWQHEAVVKLQLPQRPPW